MIPGWVLAAKREATLTLAFLVAVLLPAIGGCGGGSSSSSLSAGTPPAGQLATLQGVHTIECLGDSITQRGASPTGYVWLLQAYLPELFPTDPITVIDSGVSGDTSTDLLSRFDQDVLATNPSMVTISCGTNDCAKGFDSAHPNGGGPNGVSLTQYTENVNSMVTQANQAKIQVVLLSPAVFTEALGDIENKALGQYIAAMKSVAAQHHVLFVNLSSPFDSAIEAYQGSGGAGDHVTIDGIHPNALGSQIIAQTLLSSLGVTQAQLSAAGIPIALRTKHAPSSRA